MMIILSRSSLRLDLCENLREELNEPLIWHRLKWCEQFSHFGLLAIRNRDRAPAHLNFRSPASMRL